MVATEPCWRSPSCPMNTPRGVSDYAPDHGVSPVITSERTRRALSSITGSDQNSRRQIARAVRPITLRRFGR